MPNTDLKNRLAIVHGNPQALDTNFLAAESAFPYVSKATIGDWMIPNSGKIAR